MEKHKKIAIIIGAGPAGLTAAYELLTRTDVTPVIFEADTIPGGISRTVNYKGNRIDIGGHRFFSKSERVNEWWLNILPVQQKPSRDDIKLDRRLFTEVKDSVLNPEKTDEVMLIRPRVSRILFTGKFFDYPVSLSADTLYKLGLIRIVKVGISYLKAVLSPIKPEESLEDFFINRFGKELYETFFKDYTEKLWGVPCNEIKPDWGAQRVRGLSVYGVLKHAFAKITGKPQSKAHIETSLIDKFMYPKLGPGQLWTAVADKIEQLGGKIYYGHKVTAINFSDDRIVSVSAVSSGGVMTAQGDYFISTMPVKDLVASFKGIGVPYTVAKTASGLMYRDFITVGILLKKLKVKNKTEIKTVHGLIPDTWIYVQERDVKMGRIQMFNNWSPYLAGDWTKVWLGLEFFCNEGDSFWSKTDAEAVSFGIDELCKIGFIEKSDVLDFTVVRSAKTYPAYFGTYDNFGAVRAFTDSIDNLFLIGRNGMHRYNNMDHSMLSAMAAVDNIKSGHRSKKNIWHVNAEQEYHEEK